MVYIGWSQGAFQTWLRPYTWYIPHRRSFKISGISHSKSAYLIRLENSRSEKQKPLSHDLTSSSKLHRADLTLHELSRIYSNENSVLSGHFILFLFPRNWRISANFGVKIYAKADNIPNTDMVSVSHAMAHDLGNTYVPSEKPRECGVGHKPAISARGVNRARAYTLSEILHAYLEFPESDSMIPPLMSYVPYEPTSNMLLMHVS